MHAKLLRPSYSGLRVAAPMEIRMTPAVRIALAVLAGGVCTLAMEAYTGRAVAQQSSAKQTPAVAKKIAAVAKEAPAVAKDDPDGEDDLLGANAACYVCHTSFVKEDLAKTHLAAKVGCINATACPRSTPTTRISGPPSPMSFSNAARSTPLAASATRSTNVVPEKIIARFIERKVAKTPVVCTDCHGAHKIDAADRKN